MAFPDSCLCCCDQAKTRMQLSAQGVQVSNVDVCMRASCFVQSTASCVFYLRQFSFGTMLLISCFVGVAFLTSATIAQSPEVCYEVERVYPVVYTMVVTGHNGDQTAGAASYASAVAPPSDVASMIVPPTSTPTLGPALPSFDEQFFGISVVSASTTNNKRQTLPLKWLSTYGRVVSNANLAVDALLVNGSLQLAGQTVSIPSPWDC